MMKTRKKEFILWTGMMKMFECNSGRYNRPLILLMFCSRCLIGINETVTHPRTNETKYDGGF